MAEVATIARSPESPDPGATAVMPRLAAAGSMPPWAVVLVALFMGGGGSAATLLTSRADSQARISKLEAALEKQDERVDDIEEEAKRRDRAISDLSRTLAWVLGATLKIHKGVEGIARVTPGVEVDMSIDPLLPGSMVGLAPP